MPRPRKAAKSGLVQALFEFTQATSFHGLRYISPQSSCTRRLVWLVFVLACLVAVVIQIIDRVGHYYTWPINVNVRINYNQTLQFPAVTICNQNSFRATEAAGRGQYRLIEELFTASANTSLDDLYKHNASDVTLEDLYVRLAHKKEDFILECHWKNSKCSYDDFKMTLTDHGVCFTFNRQTSDMLISSSGIEAGLRLTLNVEQYEYMTGPHDSAGIKILLHDSREIPFVHGLGQAVPTGTHAYFGAQLMMIDNLPKPYGQCATKPLVHTVYYSTEQCYIDCLGKLEATRCGCRDLYMPHNNNTPPICNLQQYYSCIVDLQAEFVLKLREKCGCPVPCHFTIFDPSVSYASITNHLVNKILTGKEVKHLQTKYESAVEITSKMDKDKFGEFQTLSEQYVNALAHVKQVIRELAEGLGKHANRTSQFYAEITQAYVSKERMYRYQEYAIERNFLRGYEAMQERTLSSVCHTYIEFTMLCARKIRRLALDDLVSDDARKVLYSDIVDMIETSLQINSMAHENITTLFTAYKTGTPIFNYKFENISYSHNNYIVPKTLMRDSMSYNHYMLLHVPLFENVTWANLSAILVEMKVMAAAAYEDRSVDEQALEQIQERYRQGCRDFLFSKSAVYTYGLTRPLNIIKARHAEFEDTFSVIRSEVDLIQQSNAILVDTIDSTVSSHVISKLEEITIQLKNYSNAGQGTLMEIARTVLSNDTNLLSTAITKFFMELHNRVNSINDYITLLSKPVAEFWTMIINDTDTVEYYNYTNNELFLRDLDSVTRDWQRRLDGLRYNEENMHFDHLDELFYKAIADLTSHLRAFKNSIGVDRNFIKENILQLDVFYRQLSYEYINQQISYDAYALISDIGGAMGLFIGASMLTLIEILDLFMVQLCMRRNK